MGRRESLPVHESNFRGAFTPSTRCLLDGVAVWPLTDSLVDLCTGHAHTAISRCRDDIKRHAKPLKRWAIGEEDDRKTADHLRTLDLGPEWRKQDPYLCTYGFFYWGWALTCNRYLRRAWGLDPNALRR